MLFFRRRKTDPTVSPRIPPPDQPLLVELLGRLGELEIKRMEASTALKSAEIEAKLKELETEQRLKREMAEWRQERRKISQTTIKSQPRNTNGRLGSKDQSCRVCQNPSDPGLTSDEIIFHHAGHPNQNHANPS